MGGRAWRYELFPLTTNELAKPDLLRIVNHGLIPKHYLEENPERSLRSYITDYLEEEIFSESLTRNLPAFAKFLESCALSHGQLINYSNIARDCRVASKTVKEYYQILIDTLLGHKLEPWRKSKNRRLIETEKFYFFDLGIVRALRGMAAIPEKTETFGYVFEHFLIEEIRAYLAYTEKYLPMTYWRTSTGLEVDLIVGNLDVAIEFKATNNVQSIHCKGLLALMEDQKVRKALIVSQDAAPRQLQNGITVLPWKIFCKQLWAGKLV